MKFILSDPLGISFIDKSTVGKAKIDVEEFQRGWSDDKEYGFLVSKEDNFLEGEDAVSAVSKLINNAKNIVGFTGAGVSVVIFII